ncbi:carbonic anhydrase [Thermovibrio sp.]
MKKVSPSEVICEVFKTNDSFVKGRGKEYFEGHIEAQKPLITLLTCSDSRVQPNIISEEMIDKVFVIRNIGNQLENSSGSVDYGVLHLQTPLFLILGHVNCGAINAFLKGYRDEPESIRSELDHLYIPVSGVKGESFEELWQRAVEENVHWQVRVALTRYGILIRRGLLAVVGAVYDFANYYGRGYGRIVIVNVNGIKDRDKILSHKTLSLLPQELKEVVVV